MRKIQVLSSAQGDLFKIQTYTLEMWGTTKVIELQDLIDSTLTILASSPFIGRKTSDNEIYAFSLAKLPFVILYRVDTKYIYISKIIHTKRRR